MDRGLSAGEQKIAEKLIILNERGKGMLTRIYNIKKQCSDPKSRPAFLTDKPLEATIKTIVRKFPNFESHLKGQVQPIQGQEKEIVKAGLSNYYYTFVDVMQFKDYTSEVLTLVDASFVNFDISLNFDLTRAYLDLIVTYVSLMVLIARVEDRKAVLGLFNYAYEAQNGRSDEHFPRLGQLIIDYENPLKKLSEEFTTHQQRVSQALQSVHQIYIRRNQTGEQWRQSQLLSIISTPATMLEPAVSEVVGCEYLPLSTLNKWILFGYCLCYNHINDPGAVDVWKSALSDGFCISLCRDEVYMVHKEFYSFFDNLKGQGKRAKEIQECGSAALSNSPGLHRERRNYLRAAMQELSHIISDQPGLFGPKALVVIQALSLASDEVHWLVRHNQHTPSRGKKNPEDYVDQRLSYMLFLIEELYAMILKYISVLQRYYIQYLAGFDNSLLKEIIQKVAICPEDISLLMTSFTTTLSSLSVKQIESSTEFDFDGLRLDWIRLQAYTSIRGAAPEIKSIRDLAHLMNTISFHSKLVDNQEGLLSEVADLTFFSFYPTFLEEAFHQCLISIGQQKFAIAYPLLCSHFMSATNNFCPEERHLLGERSLSAVNMFLDAIAKQAKEVVQQYCKEHLKLHHQLDPLVATRWLVDAASKKKKDKNKKTQQPDVALPGEESLRKSREALTQLDAKLLALSDLSVTLNYVSHIPVWEHNFAPKEFLAVHLEDFFSKSVVKLTGYDADKQEISRPSELLQNVKVLMGVLRCVENYANVDMSRICNHAMLQQTQPVDSHGGITVCGMYSQWYVDILLRQVSSGNMLYSPNRKSFITKSATTNFKANEFTDPIELRALATLLGPYGMKYLGDRMLQQVASQMAEVKKVVKNNKDVLASLRGNFDKHEQCMEHVRRLKNVDDLLIRMTIVGVILAFRELTQEALRDVLEKRVPFLVCYVKDFHQHYPKDNNDRAAVDEMAISAGYSCDIDRALCVALRSLREKKTDEDIQTWSLLLVFIAVCIPSQAYKDDCEYNPNLEAHENNFHCLAKAIDRITVALCANNGDSIEQRLREFLVIASSSLLKLGLESEKDMPRNRESVYLLLDMIVQESPFLTMDILESCFPYCLLRNAYHHVYKKRQGGKKARSMATTVDDSSVL